VLAICGWSGRRSDAGNIAAGKGLTDGEAHLCSSRECLFHNLRLEVAFRKPVENSRQANHKACEHSVREASHANSGNLLGDDQVVEEIEFLPVDDTPQENSSSKVLPGAETHCENVFLGHLRNKFLADESPVPFLLLCLSCDELVDEHSRGLLESIVTVFVIPAGEFWAKPERLGVRNLAEGSIFLSHTASSMLSFKLRKKEKKKKRIPSSAT
jgi:hypothetical protein